jgi:hypothetical protein
MDTTFHHLIAKHGVLVSFSIAKKLSDANIKKLRARIKRKSKNINHFNQLLKDEITKSTQESIKNDKIPGLILEATNDYSDNQPAKFCNGDEKKIMKLNNMSHTIADKFLDTNLTKDEICYVMLYILTTLGLNDTDFRDFHKKYGSIDDQDNSDEDEDDDDYTDQ